MSLQASENAENLVEWALARGYKLAVKLRGITDWTNDFGSHSDDREKARREVEDYQIKIADLLLRTLENLRKDVTTK